MQAMSVNKNVNEHGESVIHASSASESEATQPYNSSTDPESANEQDQEMESSYSAPAALPAKKSYSGVSLFAKIGIVALIGAIAIAVCLIVFFVCFNKHHDDHKASGNTEPPQPKTDTSTQHATDSTTPSVTGVTTPGSTQGGEGDKSCADQMTKALHGQSKFAVRSENLKDMCINIPEYDEHPEILCTLVSSNEGPQCVQNKCAPMDEDGCRNSTVRVIDTSCEWIANPTEGGKCQLSDCVTQFDSTACQKAKNPLMPKEDACSWIPPSSDTCGANKEQESCENIAASTCEWDTASDSCVNQNKTGYCTTHTTSTSVTPHKPAPTKNDNCIDGKTDKAMAYLLLPYCASAKHLGPYLGGVIQFLSGVWIMAALVVSIRFAKKWGWGTKNLDCRGDATLPRLAGPMRAVADVLTVGLWKRVYDKVYLGDNFWKAQGVYDFMSVKMLQEMYPKEDWTADKLAKVADYTKFRQQVERLSGLGMHDVSVDITGVAPQGIDANLPSINDDNRPVHNEYRPLDIGIKALRILELVGEDDEELTKYVNPRAANEAPGIPGPEQGNAPTSFNDYLQRKLADYSADGKTYIEIEAHNCLKMIIAGHNSGSVELVNAVLNLERAKCAANLKSPWLDDAIEFQKAYGEAAFTQTRFEHKPLGHTPSDDIKRLQGKYDSAKEVKEVHKYVRDNAVRLIADIQGGEYVAGASRADEAAKGVPTEITDSLRKFNSWWADERSQHVKNQGFAEESVRSQYALMLNHWDAGEGDHGIDMSKAYIPREEMDQTKTHINEHITAVDAF